MGMTEFLLERDMKALSDVMKLRFYPLIAVSGKASVIKDYEGKEYLDLNAGWAVANTGYCHPEIISTVHDQVDKLSFSSLTSVLSESSIELAERLIALTPGKFDKKVWFGHSGSDANECIAKIAPIASGKSRIITFVGSYHGQTMGSYAMSGHPAQNKLIGGGNVTKVPYPYCYRCAFEKEYPSCGLFCMRYLEDYILKSVCPADQTAAIVIEAIQSDGGDVVPPDGYLQGLQEICRKNDIYLVLDEVKVGFGRTGKFFGFENWGIVPDVVIMGKPIASGLPLSAVVGRKEIMDCGIGLHMFTTAGNPIACAAGLKTIDILKDENMIENAKSIGEYMLNAFKSMQKKYSVIGDVRGKGLIIGIELIKDRDTKEPAAQFAALVSYRAYELGVLFYYAGIHSNVLELTPPLTLSYEEADKAINVIRQAIEDVLDHKIDPRKLEAFAGWACN